MPSASLLRWQNDRMPRLAEIDAQCAASLAAMPSNPYLVEENLRGYVLLLSAHFQGFCRDLYTECSQVVVSKVRAALQMLIQVGFAPDEVKSLKIKRGHGCDRCKNAGYRGRIGLYEVLHFSDEIREMVLSGASSIELKRKAIEEGMVSLRSSGLHKIRGGVTTLEEVLRETVL